MKIAHLLEHTRTHYRVHNLNKAPGHTCSAIFAVMAHPPYKHRIGRPILRVGPMADTWRTHYLKGLGGRSGTSARHILPTAQAKGISASGTPHRESHFARRTKSRHMAHTIVGMLGGRSGTSARHILPTAQAARRTKRSDNLRTTQWPLREDYSSLPLARLGAACHNGKRSAAHIGAKGGGQQETHFRFVR